MKKNCREKVSTNSSELKWEYTPSVLSRWLRSQRAEMAERRGFEPLTAYEYYRDMRHSSLDERLDYFCAYLKNYRPTGDSNCELRRAIAKNGEVFAPTYFSPFCDDVAETLDYFRDIIYQNIAYNKALGYSSKISLDVWVDDDLVFSTFHGEFATAQYVAFYCFC